MTDNWQEAGFGLYIHWPFCMAKCPYCDFNSHVVSKIDQQRWKRAYLSELHRTAEQTSGRFLTSIYFGGGTPSLMHPDVVASVIEATSELWPFSNDVEITLEANPTSADTSFFRGYRDAGVNRLSLGIQALNDKDLRALGRMHDVREARTALEMATNRFSHVSFDLIYARQDQSLTQWKRELGEALSMPSDHLSLYQLTIEKDTAFGTRFANGKLLGLPDEDLSADMFYLTQDMCTSAGMPAYETSNHATKGNRSRHNLIYWRGGDYAGIGPGAHGRLTIGGTRYATTTPLAPEVWLRSVEDTGNGEMNRKALTGLEIAGEYLMMGLRLSEGISMHRLGKWMDTETLSDKIASLEEIGVIQQEDNKLRLTDRGKPLLNAVLRELLP